MFVFVRVFQRNKTGGRYIDIYKAVYYRTWIMLSCRLTPKLCLQVGDLGKPVVAVQCELKGLNSREAGGT